ncbi:zincin, partial [Exidia glandulosa HHB12029]
MSLNHLCTQMPAQDRAQADMLAVQENSYNGHQVTAGFTGPPRGAIPVKKMWRNGRTLRVKILNGSSKVRSKIQQYANAWTPYMNLKLEFVPSGQAEIRVTIDVSNASWSYVGTDALAADPNSQTMNFGWLTDNTSEIEFSRVITHEFGHALGCIHEHQSPAADIPWDKPAVYAYYQKTQDWTEAQVDQNIFEHFNDSTTQFSAFDPRSIILYAIPASLTTNRLSVGWNTELSATDQSFISSAYPATIAADVAYFNTMEVRPWDKPAKEAMKSQHLAGTGDAAPTLALGLNCLDVGNNANLRVNAFADNVSASSADVHIDTWADTTLYAAAVTWFTVPAGNSDFQTGSFCTEDDHAWDHPQQKTARQITFTRPYAAPPKVIVWLCRLDLDRSTNYRVTATGTDVTTTGFTLHLDTWADTKLYSATASWIAYPANRANITSGTYSITDVRPWDKPQSVNAGRIQFPSGCFQDGHTPQVFHAFNSLDVDRKANVRVKLGADNVGKDGFDWHIDSWADTVLYSAGVSYIAV